MLKKALFCLCAPLTISSALADSAPTVKPDFSFNDIVLNVQTLFWESDYHLSRIGATQKVQNDLRNGQGVTIGILDTGIYAGHNEFQGRISPEAGCVASFSCSSAVAYQDINGHGSHVAGLAAAARNGRGMVGTAPQATILPVKISELQNGASSLDAEARGMRYAADKGARVINLSYQHMWSPDFVAAVNYATSKNAVILLAGGNNGQNYFNDKGLWAINNLTPEALKRLIVVGATEQKTAWSWSSFKMTSQEEKVAFSAMPGSELVQGRNFYNNWIMAPGVDLVSVNNDPQTFWGVSYNEYVRMSGTSMATPVVSGAVALLASRWPHLLNKGTIAEILFRTASDMGTAGADAVYGNGFLQVDKAAQPIGSLVIPTSDGRRYALSSYTILSNGVMGDLGSINSRLTSTIGTDDYVRDYLITASPIATKSKSNTSATPILRTIQKRFGFLQGKAFGSFDMTSQETPWHPASSSLFGEKSVTDELVAWRFALSEGDTYVAGGKGYSPSLSLTQAMWGQRSAFAQGDLSTAASLLSLSGDGHFGVTSFSPTDGQKLTVAFNTVSYDAFADNIGVTSGANAFALGYAIKLSDRTTLGVTSSVLNEKNMFLGTRAGDALSMGEQTTSSSVGLGVDFALGKDSSLAFDATYARTPSGSVSGSLIEKTSNVHAAGFGAALRQDNAFTAGDSLSFGVKKPLRVYSGSADLAIPVGVDEMGTVVFDKSRATLKPDGSETMIQIGYEKELIPGIDASGTVSFRNDADNIRGERDYGTMLNLSARF